MLVIGYKLQKKTPMFGLKKIMNIDNIKSFKILELKNSQDWVGGSEQLNVVCDIDQFKVVVKRKEKPQLLNLSLKEKVKMTLKTQ
jgi:hypothetical protein